MQKNIFRKLFRCVFVFSIFYFLFSIDFIHADVPNYINYQGRLRYQGQPVSGTRNFVFGIYTQASGGAATWEENEDVKVSTGIYSHSLGSGNLVTGNWSTIDWASIGANCYLSVNVAGSGELLPRMKFEAVPYSFVAKQLWGNNVVTTTSGNVGIGTTNPLTNLYVVGTTSITSNTWIDGDMNLKGTLKATGNVGIGTTNPLTNLYVVGTTSITSNAWIDGNLNLKGALKAGGDITGGNVGVGTTNPLTNLYVVGTTSITSNAWIDGDLTLKSTFYCNKIIPKNTGNSVFIGDGAGIVDDLTDNKNNFIGYQAGYKNTSGYQNNFVGSYAGYFNTSGYQNNFFGFMAGNDNTSGSGNNFFGFAAGENNTTGSNNNFIGSFSGDKNTEGHSNNFIGSSAGYNNTTGDSGVFLGFQAGLANTIGSYNNFLGAQSGLDNTEGNYNTFLGYQSGMNNTTGDNNNFLGYRTGYFTETGSNNIVIGHSAAFGASGKSFSGSTIIGANAGYSNTTGSRNTLIGYRAGYGLTTGGYNIVITTDASSFPAATDNSKLNIGDTIYGDLAARNIGIGVVNPTSTFQVNGDIRAMQQPGCSARKITTHQTISNGAATAVTFNSETWDYGNMHDNSTNPERFVLPSDGRYLVTARITFNDAQTGGRYLTIQHSTKGQLASSWTPPSGSANLISIEISAIIEAEKDSYITVEATQHSGGDLDVRHTQTAIYISKLN